MNIEQFLGSSVLFWKKYFLHWFGTFSCRFRSTVSSIHDMMMSQNSNAGRPGASVLLSIRSPRAPDRHLRCSQCQCLLPLLTPLHHIIPLISSISLWAVVYFHHQMPDEICGGCVLGSNPHK